MDFWLNTLGSPQKIVAPMVDASELAWRVLSRRYGAELCYTPMLHSSVFCRDPKYRKEALATCEEDKPLIVQFCGNDPKIMLEAALLAEDYCTAVDINLGCPQAIAKRGRYGSYLQDDWQLLTDIVSTLSKSLKVPVTCKIRVFEDMDKTIRYARMLEDAGCKMLTVHGRTREQKGPLTGLANWDYVKEVRNALSIPVISNGNIQCMADVENCLQYTKAAGVMSAEGNLYNPALFSEQTLPVWEPAILYLDLLELYPCPSSYTRGHLFKLYQHLLVIPENNELRLRLGASSTLDDFRDVTNILKSKYLPYHEGKLYWLAMTEDDTYNLILPPWICQSYVRISPEEHIKRVEEKRKEEQSKTINENEVSKRSYSDGDGNAISRKRMKKLRRINRRPEKQNVVPHKRGLDKCTACANPLGSKCIFKLCKKCCRSKCFLENLDCSGHRILVRSRREMAQHYADLRNKNKMMVVN